jgi:hypothetical protein
MLKLSGIAISPPSGSRDRLLMGRSISASSCTSTTIGSTANDEAALSIAVSHSVVPSRNGAVVVTFRHSLAGAARDELIVKLYTGGLLAGDSARRRRRPPCARTWHADRPHSLAKGESDDWTLRRELRPDEIFGKEAVKKLMELCTARGW